MWRMSEDTELSVVEKRTYNFILFFKHLFVEKKRASDREKKKKKKKKKKKNGNKGSTNNNK